MEKEFNFNNELSGRIAMVTGGTKGTGKAIAQRLLAAGAQVIITARNKPEEPNEKLYFISADLSKSDGTAKVVTEVLSKFGRLDILINSLGGSMHLAAFHTADLLCQKMWQKWLGFLSRQRQVILPEPNL